MAFVARLHQHESLRPISISWVRRGLLALTLHSDLSYWRLHQKLEVRSADCSSFFGTSACLPRLFGGKTLGPWLDCDTFCNTISQSTVRSWSYAMENHLESCILSTQAPECWLEWQACNNLAVYAALGFQEVGLVVIENSSHPLPPPRLDVQW